MTRRIIWQRKICCSKGGKGSNKNGSKLYLIPVPYLVIEINKPHKYICLSMTWINAIHWRDVENFLKMNFCPSLWWLHNKEIMKTKNGCQGNKEENEQKIYLERLFKIICFKHVMRYFDNRKLGNKRHCDILHAVNLFCYQVLSL